MIKTGAFSVVTAMVLTLVMFVLGVISSIEEARNAFFTTYAIVGMTLVARLGLEVGFFGNDGASGTYFDTHAQYTVGSLIIFTVIVVSTLSHLTENNISMFAVSLGGMIAGLWAYRKIFADLAFSIASDIATE